VSDDELEKSAGTVYKDDVEVASSVQKAVVDALLKNVEAVAKKAQEPSLQWFDNQFNYQKLWSDETIVNSWRAHPHQEQTGLFERLQSIYDNCKDAQRWFFIGKKFAETGLDLVHMNAGVGSPDGLILIQVKDSKWVAVFLAFQVDFYDPRTSERPRFRPHPPSLPSTIEITDVDYDPPENDAGKESITLLNKGDEDANLKGWKITAIRSSTERRYVLPPIILPAKKDLKIFVTEELFPNKGATVTLRDLEDRIRAATEYPKAGNV